MEWVEGATVQQILQAGPGPLPLAQVFLPGLSPVVNPTSLRWWPKQQQRFVPHWVWR